MIVFSESECAWLERRAREIAETEKLPLPIALSQARGQLIWNRQKPKADVFAIAPAPCP